MRGVVWLWGNCSLSVVTECACHLTEVYTEPLIKKKKNKVTKLLNSHVFLLGACQRWRMLASPCEAHVGRGARGQAPLPVFHSCGKVTWKDSTSLFV